MAVTGLANLAVKVADLEAACAWYEAAGATVTEPIEWENGRRADVQLGVARPDPVHPGDLRGRLHVCPTRGSCTPPSSSTTSTPSWPATPCSGVPGRSAGPSAPAASPSWRRPGGIRLEFMEQLEPPPDGR